MKTRLLAIVFFATMCAAGLSSCAEEEVNPIDHTEVKKQKGAQGVEDGF